MWFQYERGILVVMFLLYQDAKECEAISNTQFNASLRDYYVPEENANTTEVKTLQKDLSERYAHKAPVSNIVRFKDVPDSVLSGSSHGRGLHHLNHHAYGLADYEESPHYGYGYEYQYPDEHHGHYDEHDHHSDHHGHHVIYHDDHKHGYGHGHHHKHYDHHHALAAKTVLWPIAGIALLGAAAALVSNPVLLQLGVVSGRRRRREAGEHTNQPDTNDSLTTEHVLTNLKNFNKNEDPTRTKRNNKSADVRKNVFNKVTGNNHRLLFGYVNPTVKTIHSINTAEHNRYSADKHYIPIPLKIKENGSD